MVLCWSLSPLNNQFVDLNQSLYDVGHEAVPLRSYLARLVVLRSSSSHGLLKTLHSPSWEFSSLKTRFFLLENWVFLPENWSFLPKTLFGTPPVLTQCYTLK